MSAEFFERTSEFALAHGPFAPSIEESRTQPLRDVLEPLLGLMLLIVVAPVMFFCALAVKLTSRGPVLYTQKRIGKNGATFDIVKFRTMRVGAEDKTGPVLSAKSDNRLTIIGGLLRNLHLDELPQLINIARGDMSLIGPRPERPFFVDQFKQEIARYSHRHLIKPGITGLAQICCGYDAKADVKLKYDLLYIEQSSSLRMNAWIVFYTFLKLFKVAYNS